MTQITERNSAFELLRLIAQYMIVAYHILLFWFVNAGLDPVHVYKAVCIPLHIGVLLYVLISGYFGIRFSLRGILKLVVYLLIYGLLFLLLSNIIYGDMIEYKQFFFVSNTDFWFVRTYLMLYLVAPILNRIIKELSATSRFFLIGILLWMSCYVGFLGYDNSLTEGKTLVHFVLLYLIGDTIRVYQERLNNCPKWIIVLSYIFINLLSILLYIGLLGSSLEGIMYAMVFKYNGLILLINAICLFLLFTRIHIQSKMINWLASSCLAIYLIHSSNLFLMHPIQNAALYIQEQTPNTIYRLFLVFMMALVVMICCIIIDKLFTPIWSLTNLITEKINHTRLGKLIQKYQ